MTNKQIHALEKLLSGQLIRPAHADYNEARKVYNGMIDKHPAAIARCSNVEDVKACVQFAAANHILLAIRGGGHNAAGLGVADDALVIDLGLLKKIDINRKKGTVRVEGGVLLKELDAATHECGMCVPSGIFGSTGVAGLTLGGGLGYLSRKHGLSVDQLLETEVVLASGKVVNASKTENADLFWALSGGGGNFGVVVSFLFKMQPTHTIIGGPMLWPVEDGKEMLQWFHECITTAPDDASGFFAYLTVPPVEPFPVEYHGHNMCGIVWCITGEEMDANAVLDAARKVKKPSIDFTGPLPLPALQTMFDGLYPPGLLWYWKADFIKDMPAEAIDIHQHFGKNMPTPFSTMHLYAINGAAGRVSPTATAWNYRDANYGMVIVGIANNESDRDAIVQWTRDYWWALHPYSMGGAYVNMMMEEGDERIKASYGKNYERLRHIKAKYDPDNLFRVNQNIQPAVEELTVP